MRVDFVPSLAVATSLAAAAFLPLLVTALSHGPMRIAAPGRRFVAASLLTWTIWIGGTIAIAPGAVDLVTGAMLLATASLVSFTLWTLVAWGFTLSMLLVLSRAGRPLTVDEWSRLYTRGRPLEVFARDRLGVLFALGLAQRVGERVVITPVRGRLFARAAGALRILFGLPR